MPIILIGFVLISNVYYALASYECDKYFSNNEPSFSLISRNKNPVINPGDTLEFEIYIIGNGAPPNFSKLYITLPIGLVDANKIYGSSTTFFIDSSGDLKQYTYILGPGHEKENILNINIPYYYFQYIPTEGGCSILAEKRWENSKKELIPPFLIKVNTSKSVSEGDNKIDIILAYTDGKKWYQDRQDVKFHINSFWETWYIYHIIITGVVVAILGDFGIRLYTTFIRRRN